MPGYSVLTNPSAASAVLNLNKTLTALNTTQERINTGLRVGRARDDASTFAIALGMRSDIGGFRAVRENLSLGQSTLGVASTAGDSIAEQISIIKSKVVQAANNTQGRQLIQEDIDKAVQQIRSITTAATFSGINLINGDEANIGQSFTVISSLDRDSVGDLTLGTVDVAYEDLSVDNTGRGLYDLTQVDVTQGRVSSTSQSFADGEIRTANIDMDDGSTLAAGDTVTVSYIDANGDQQDLVFTAIDSTTNSGGPFDFGATDGAATFDADNASANLAAAINALSQSGGPLADLGITAVDAGGATGQTSIELEGPGAVGQIVGFSASTAAAGDLVTTTTEAQVGIAQLDLQINEPLQAGDEIKLTVNNGINDTLITLVVGEKGAAENTSGELIDGTVNKFVLAYDEVVENTATGVVRTPEEIATVIAGLMDGSTAAVDPTVNDDDAGNLQFVLNNAVTSGVFSGAGNPDFNVQVVGDSVRIIDLKVNGPAQASQLVGFEGNAVTGTSLNFEQMLQQIDAAEDHLKQVVGRIGAAEKRIESQSVFIDNLVKAINDGVGTLVDADMSEESARFQALQVQQQLGLQALSIANAQPQAILSLFGG